MPSMLLRAKYPTDENIAIINGTAKRHAAYGKMKVKYLYSSFLIVNNFFFQFLFCSLTGVDAIRKHEK